MRRTIILTGPFITHLGALQEAHDLYGHKTACLTDVSNGYVEDDKGTELIQD
jgi:hypothetical protein